MVGVAPVDLILLAPMKTTGVCCLVRFGKRRYATAGGSTFVFPSDFSFGPLLSGFFFFHCCVCVLFPFRGLKARTARGGTCNTLRHWQCDVGVVVVVVGFRGVLDRRIISCSL